MPYEVLASQLSNPDDFKAAVDAYVLRLKAWTTEVGTPRPAAPHPLIEACVQRVHRPDRADDFVPDYFITDDRPPPPSLAERKQPLLIQLQQLEQAAKDKIMSQNKMRLFILEMQAAEAVRIEDRTAEQNDTIVAFMNFKKAFFNIEMQAARAESAIADLTEDNIDSWVLPQIG